MKNDDVNKKNILGVYSGEKGEKNTTTGSLFIILSRMEMWNDGFILHLWLD